MLCSVYAPDGTQQLISATTGRIQDKIVLGQNGTYKLVVTVIDPLQAASVPVSVTRIQLALSPIETVNWTSLSQTAQFEGNAGQTLAVITGMANSLTAATTSVNTMSTANGKVMPIGGDTSIIMSIPVDTSVLGVNPFVNTSNLNLLGASDPPFQPASTPAGNTMTQAMSSLAAQCGMSVSQLFGPNVTAPQPASYPVVDTYGKPLPSTDPSNNLNTNIKAPGVGPATSDNVGSTSVTAGMAGTLTNQINQYTDPTTATIPTTTLTAILKSNGISLPPADQNKIVIFPAGSGNYAPSPATPNIFQSAAPTSTLPSLLGIMLINKVPTNPIDVAAATQCPPPVGSEGNLAKLTNLPPAIVGR
jgi:hypothetical protein